MKRFMLGALGALATSSVAAPAAATIVSPSPGSPVTVAGAILIQAGFLNVDCTVAFDATIGSGTTAWFTGGSGACGRDGIALFTVENAPWQKSLLVSDGVLTGEWRLDGVRFTIAAATLISCTYFGGLSGTWSSDGRDTVLTITMTLSTLLLDVSRSSPLCGSNPFVRRTLTLHGVATA